MGNLGLIPELGRSPGEGHGNPLQYSYLENPHGQSLVGYSPWGRKESDMTEWLSFHLLSIGKICLKTSGKVYACLGTFTISHFWNAAAAVAKSLQLCPTLCDPIDSSPPGSPVPGILQARTLEWAAISFSNAWKWKGSCSVMSDS